jgi:putative transposase
LPYLGTAAVQDHLEQALERMRRRYLFVVAGYVVMPEHVHLLMSEPRLGLLSRAVQAFKLSVTARRPERPY